ncbi:MAG TPA: heme-binding protein [Erysipelotrichaceae bacterium]|nr:heme-binding protein [Erysipelotrichaceae bacterium]
MAKYNTLDYTVILSEGDFEIREYKNFFIVEYENVDDPNTDKGFTSLFRYISNDNQAKAKISMTTPGLTNKSESVKKLPL